MRLKSVLALCAMVVVAVIVASVTLSCSGDTAPAAPLHRIPAQQLPYPMSVSVPPFEVTWGEGVLEAANMYFPAELEMLEVIHSEPTKQEAFELAARIGELKSSKTLAELPEQSTAEEGCYRWNFGSVEVSIFRDGNAGLVWHDRDLPAEYFTDPHADPAPRITVDEAVAVADRFLKDAGLLPEGARMTDITSQDAISRHNQATGRDESAALACSVMYRRFRDGIPEGRMGGCITGKGEIFSFSRNMRNVRSLGRYPILRPDEAREMMWSPAARVETSNAPRYRPVTAAIEKVEMEYYDGATAWRYDTIQPIYIFTGTGWDGQGRPQSFTAMVPAVRPEFLEPVTLPRAGGAVVESGKTRGHDTSRKHSTQGKPKPD